MLLEQPPSERLVWSTGDNNNNGVELLMMMMIMVMIYDMMMMVIMMMIMMMIMIMTPRLGTISGGRAEVMLRATTGRRTGSTNGCKCKRQEHRNMRKVHF